MTFGSVADIKLEIWQNNIRWFLISKIFKINLKCINNSYFLHKHFLISKKIKNMHNNS